MQHFVATVVVVQRRRNIYCSVRVCARALVCSSVDGSYVAAHTTTTAAAILVVVHYEEGWAEAERYLHRTAS